MRRGTDLLSVFSDGSLQLLVVQCLCDFGAKNNLNKQMGLKDRQSRLWACPSRSKIIQRLAYRPAPLPGGAAAGFAKGLPASMATRSQAAGLLPGLP